MKTCLIFGLNCLDFDVVLNVEAFYKHLGFKVFFSNKLYEADLLVVVRASTPIDLSPYHFQLIHVFDYEGGEIDAFVSSTDYQKTYICTSSETHRQRIIHKTGFPANQIFKAFPPVETKIWMEKNKKISYDLVHIGHFKLNEDTIRTKLVEIIQTLNVDVWGERWEHIAPKKYYHGKLGLFNVSKIYAKSKYALGLMLPHQRNETYSGRFWHAPLNGCYILSEPGLYTKEIPGIIETDHSLSDVSLKISKNTDREALKKEAEQYWKIQSNITLSCLQPSFVLINKKENMIKKLILYYKISRVNMLKKIYQRFSVFKIANSIKSKKCG